MDFLGFIEDLTELAQAKLSKWTNPSGSQFVANSGRFAAIKRRVFHALSKKGIPFSKTRDSTRTAPMDEIKDEIEQTMVVENLSPSSLPLRSKPVQKRERTEKPKKTKERKPLPKLPKLNLSLADVAPMLKSLLSKAVVVSILGVIVWACWSAYRQGDYVAVAAVLLVALGSLIGFWRGIIGTIISLVGFVAAYLTAPQLGAAYEQLASDQLGTTGILNRAIAIGAAGLVVFIVFSIVSSLVWKMASGEQGERSIIDRILGLAGGAVQSALCVLLFLGGFSVIKPALPTAAQVPEDAVAPQRILALSNAIDRSQLKPWVERYNPFEKVPQFEDLADIQQTIAKLDGPERVRFLMKHPTVMELRKDPEMKKAVAGLAGEEEIVELMSGKRPFGKGAVSTLLQSNAVLNLIEQPGFLEAAKTVLVDAEKESAESQTPVSKSPVSQSPPTRTRYTSKKSGS